MPNESSDLISLRQTAAYLATSVAARTAAKDQTDDFRSVTAIEAARLAAVQVEIDKLSTPAPSTPAPAPDIKS